MVLIIILIAVFGALLFTLGIVEEKIFTACVGSFLIASTTLLLIIVLHDPYKEGQVDALTGKVKYHLVTLPDSTKEWREIKNK